MQVPQFWLRMPDRPFCLRKELFPQLYPGVISNTAHLSSLILLQQSNKEKRIERAPQEAEETPQEIPWAVYVLLQGKQVDFHSTKHGPDHLDHLRVQREHVRTRVGYAWNVHRPDRVYIPLSP